MEAEKAPLIVQSEGTRDEIQAAPFVYIPNLAHKLADDVTECSI